MRKTKRKKKALHEQVVQTRSPQQMEIEVIKESLSDEELIEFANAFLGDLADLKPMKHVSLLTENDAKEAASYFNSRQQLIQKRLESLKTIKRLLISRSNTPDSDLN